MNESIYIGIEPARALTTPLRHPLDMAFSVASPTLPPNARPLIDDVSGECVGYVQEGATNVWHVFDVAGDHVGIEEKPLEAAPIDPFDLILIGGVTVKLVRAGVSWVARSSVLPAAVSLTGSFSRFVPVLRNKLFGVSARQLQFTATTARHMTNPGRFVPVHILHLAIRHGRRVPDPQKIAGVFRYEVAMTRFVKRGTTYIRENKTLEVVVRESDWTVLHFMYF